MTLRQALGSFVTGDTDGTSWQAVHDAVAAAVDQVGQKDAKLVWDFTVLQSSIEACVLLKHIWPC